MRVLKYSFVFFMLVVALAACDNKDTIATVGGDSVSANEFSAYLKFKRIPQQDKKRVARALDEYLKRAALTQAIQNSGELDAGLMRAELEEFRRQMYISRYFEDYLRNTVDDEAVQNYYASHEKQYQTQRAHAAHILIRVNTKMSETERQAKLTSAQEVYSHLQKGEDFAEVAKTYSEDAVSAKKGGDLGWLRKGAVDPKFSQTLFSMKPGDVSEPFLTSFGFHIVKLIEGPQLVKRPLDAVKGDIRYQLRNQAKVEKTESLLNSINVKRNVTPDV